MMFKIELTNLAISNFEAQEKKWDLYNWHLTLYYSIFRSLTTTILLF